MDIMQLLQGQLSQGVLQQLTNQIGAEDPKQTSVAASSIISTLLGGLAKNASSPEGANSLFNALDRDHDGNGLEDLMGLLTGQSKNVNPSATNGMGILNHILGPKQSGAANLISQISGLDSGKTGNLMAILAPMVMQALGKAKNQGGLDISGLASLLGGTVNQRQENPTMSLVTSFLDADGDGSITDDLMGMVGNKLLGGLFGKK